jgi:hypothetical protein
MLLSLFSWGALAGLVTALLRILASLLEIVSPVLKGLLELLIEYLKWMWSGLIDVVDDIKTVAFVLSLCLGIYVYGHWTKAPAHKAADREIVKLVNQIKAQKQLIACLRAKKCK